MKNSKLGRINFSLANEIRKKQAKEAKAGRRSTLDLPVLEPPHILKRSGSRHGTISNSTKRVSWTSSAPTARDSHRSAGDSRSSALPGETAGFLNIPAHASHVSVSPLPRAQDSHTRVDVSHMSNPRAPRSRELIGNIHLVYVRIGLGPIKLGTGRK